MMLVLLSGVLLSGCAQQNRADYYTLRGLEADCRNKVIQMKFLQNQLALSEGTSTSLFSSVSPQRIYNSVIGGADEQTIEGRRVSDVRHEGRLKELIWELRSSCD